MSSQTIYSPSFVEQRSAALDLLPLDGEEIDFDEWRSKLDAGSEGSYWEMLQAAMSLVNDALVLTNSEGTRVRRRV